MRFLLLIAITLILFSSFYFKAYSKTPLISDTKKYEAIVSGKLIKSKVIKSGNLYLTEYKLKTTKWLFKKSYIKERKIVKIKILGADLQKKGLVIKASISPNNITLNKEAVFLLNKTKKQNLYTIPKEGIIYKEPL
jgi:hypothetical protein